MMAVKTLNQYQYECVFGLKLCFQHRVECITAIKFIFRDFNNYKIAMQY